MRAVQLLNWKSEPEFVEVAKPTPSPGQVVIKIGAAGLCHSDLHLMHDFDQTSLPWSPPFTLGHENAGWVDSIGAGVTTVHEGQAVAVYGPWGCGLCERCRMGFETYCDNTTHAPIRGGGGGLGLDGGLAEYMLIPHERFLIALPEGIDPLHAAPLTDAGLTPYHAVRRSMAKLTPGAWVVVIGVGGLGHMSIQILKATCASRIIAVDPRPAARELALLEGADFAVAPEEAHLFILDQTNGRGAEVVLDFVGNKSTINLGVGTTRILGDYTLVGLSGGDFAFSFFSQKYEVSLQTTYWGSRPELIEVLELGARGLLRAKIEPHTLEQAINVYQDLAEGYIDGRAVIVP